LMDLRRRYLLRSTSWTVSPGIGCPGSLELTASALEFRPNRIAWIVGGFGGDPGLSIPLECIHSVSSSTLGGGLSRGWPGRVLHVEIASGRRIAFGVPRISDWTDVLRGHEGGGRACSRLDARLAAIRRTLAVDIAASTAAVASAVALLSLAGETAGYSALAAVIALRYAMRGAVSRGAAD